MNADSPRPGSRLAPLKTRLSLLLCAPPTLEAVISSPHTPTERPQRSARASTGSRKGSATLRLAPNGDGWSLVGPRGSLIFQAPGIQGRQRCLRYAQAEGVLTILT